MEYWCSACGKWGNHYRANHPADPNHDAEPINARIAGVVIHNQPPVTGTLGATVPVAEMQGQASHTATAPTSFGNVTDTTAFARLRTADLIEWKVCPSLISALTCKEMIDEVIRVLSPQRDTGGYASIFQWMVISIILNCVKLTNSFYSYFTCIHPIPTLVCYVVAYSCVAMYIWCMNYLF